MSETRDIRRRLDTMSRRLGSLENKLEAIYITTRISADAAELARAISRADKRGVRKNLRQLSKSVDKLGKVL